MVYRLYIKLYLCRIHIWQHFSRQTISSKAQDSAKFWTFEKVLIGFPANVKKDIFEQKRGDMSKENSRPLDIDAGLLHDIREYIPRYFYYFD